MIVEVQQQTGEWLQMRVGAVTASRMADVMAKLKRGGEPQCRKDYRAELVCERLTGLKYEHYVTPSMEWGIEHEKLARAAYEMETGFSVEVGGLAIHDRIKWLMASPDGMVHDDGLVEFKCPTTATHIDWFTAGVVPDEYHWQMLCQMACADRKWCDFVSYDPRLPESLQLFIRRFDRDDARIAEMEAEVVKFVAEVEDTIIAFGKKVVPKDSGVPRAIIPPFPDFDPAQTLGDS